MKFLIDAMLPPSVAELLDALGHDGTTPSMLGAHNLPDDVLVQLASADNRVIVTENASDFAAVTDCPVLFVLKSWWPAGSLASRLAAALDRWAKVNPEPGAWPHWLPDDLRRGIDHPASRRPKGPQACVERCPLPRTARSGAHAGM